MHQALTVIGGLLIDLFDLVVAAIATIDGVIRRVLAGVGIRGPAQSAILILTSIVLAIAAIRLFGRVVAILIIVFLILLLFEPGHATLVGLHG